MAEAVFSHLCKDRDFSVLSCGLYACEGDRLTHEAKVVLANNGIEFQHSARRVSEKELCDADYIVGMTSSHAAELCIMFPKLKERIFSFPTDVSDPFGGDEEIYEECYHEIYEGIKAIKEAIFKDEA